MKNRLNRTFTDAEHRSKFALRVAQLGEAANFTHLRLRELCLRMVNAAFDLLRIKSRRTTISLSGATLSNHVPRIVQTGTREQMFWSYTLPIVTTMQDKHPIGNSTKGLSERPTMGKGEAVFYLQLPIARSIQRRLPIPASSGFYNLAPEARM